MKALKNILVVIISIIITLTFIEVCFRIYFTINNSESFEDAIMNSKNPPVGSTATLGVMIRPSLNPKIIYQLKPNLDVIFPDGHLKIPHLWPGQNPPPSDSRTVVS